MVIALSKGTKIESLLFMKYGVIGEYVNPLFLEIFQVKFVANKSSLNVESFFNFNLSIPHFIVVSNPPPAFGVITS